MNDKQTKGYFAYWDDETYPMFGNFLQEYSVLKDAECHIGWHEAVDEVMHEPFGIKMPKLVVCPKTGTIMPHYYLEKAS